MPWAGPNQVSQEKFAGAISITAKQYAAGIDALCSGKYISIEKGFEIIDDPEEIIPDPSEPTIEDYRSAAQLFVDMRAKERGYNDAVTLASYVGSTILEWASEAKTFVAWRDQVWLYANEQLRAVQAGERDQPSVAEFIDELPKLEWPTDDQGSD